MARKPRVQQLTALLKYRFDEPIDRFCETFFVEKKDARPIWKDMLRYLWLAGSVKDAKDLEPPRIIDEMWHMFLVYTIEYRAWSAKYFDAYVHHKPKTTADKRAEKRRAERGDLEAHRKHLVKSISTVWDHLGERTALRWYVKYPMRYDTKFYDRRRPVTPEVEVKLPRALVDRAMRT